MSINAPIGPRGGPRPVWIPMWIMMSLLIALSGVVISGCGGGRGGARAPAPRVFEGEGAFVLRANRLPCVVETREFDFEALTPVGWERVAVETVEQPELLDRLIRLTANRDGALVQVEGRVTGVTRPWRLGHRARVLQLQSVPETLGPVGEAIGVSGLSGDQGLVEATAPCTLAGKTITTR